jgi:lipopolysaccharide biosynthesis protein
MGLIEVFMKVIAWHLPQFHEFEENNQFWGQGFTEWTHLRKAQSQYPGHRVLRPHPDMGYYCLEDIEARRKQAALAKKYGVYGFCYYHYWFYDKPLMQKPLELMLQDGEPDLPFCFSWANEPWKNSMNGGDSRIIMPQQYGDEREWEAHFQFLKPFFQHSNHIQIDGRPILLVYRVSEIANYPDRFRYWDNRCKDLGFNGIFIISTLGNFHNDPHEDVAQHVAATVEFFPNFLGDEKLMTSKVGRQHHYDCEKVKQHILHYPRRHQRQFSGLLTGFDNSARNCLRCNIIQNTTPEWFGDLLREKEKASTEEYIFVNAWNEWSEGAVLEPEEVYGYRYLQQINNTKIKML